MASTIKASGVPLFLFSLPVFYQLVFLPLSFPPSHYDVLETKRYSSVEEVKEAYGKLSSKREIPSTNGFIKIQCAYELMTNPLCKRDYDIFGLGEQSHIIDKINLQYTGESFSGIDLPLLDATTFDLGDHTFTEITSQDFATMFNSSKPWPVLGIFTWEQPMCSILYFVERNCCSVGWCCQCGVVELGELQLAMSLAERKPTGQFFHQNGLPSLVAFPSGCKTSGCLVRFEGDLSLDAVTNWFATTVGYSMYFYYFGRRKKSMS